MGGDGNVVYDFEFGSVVEWGVGGTNQASKGVEVWNVGRLFVKRQGDSVSRGTTHVEVGVVLNAEKMKVDGVAQKVGVGRRFCEDDSKNGMWWAVLWALGGQLALLSACLMVVPKSDYRTPKSYPKNPRWTQGTHPCLMVE